MKVVIVGAGPAGIMTAIRAAENNCQVTILEKNSIAGKKLNITGKGRCNITYKGDTEYFLANVVTNPKFMLSSINTLDNDKLINFVSSLGIRLKEERGNRIFLASDDAHELTEALLRRIKELKIKIEYNSIVKELILNNGIAIGVKLENDKKLYADKIVIATGGKSYMSTGSTGDGYSMAEKVGHTIETIRPALVPFVLKEKNICRALRGVTLKNVDLKVVIDEKVIDNRFGELMFTDKGITGPIVLSSSSKINKVEGLGEFAKDNKVKVQIDLKPALTYDELYKRITRDFEKYSNKEFKNSLNELTISSLIPIIVEKSGIDEAKKVNVITKKEKEQLTKVFKSLEFTFERLEDVNVGIVTSGGISTKEINPKTMESKKVKNLYFAGEIIDVDAYTGGFNLQIAFSTGFAAGNGVTYGNV